MNPKIVFVGSPEFAVPSLRRLVSEYPVNGVITQPDQPAGRGRNLQPSPVKLFAQSIGLPIFQPVSMKSEDAMQKLSEWAPDLIVVVAFGQILRKKILDFPKWGCLNIHGSLLPRWRGAAPIQAAILAGDAETGVTLMKMDQGVDTGPIICQKHISIFQDDTTISLGDRMSQAGADLLLETLPGYINGEHQLITQDEGLATYAGMIKKADGELFPYQPVDFLERKVRALTPWPGTYLQYKNDILKIHKTHIIWDTKAKPGIRSAMGGFPVMGAEGGWLVLEIVQPAGKKPVQGNLFLRGAREWEN